MNNSSLATIRVNANATNYSQGRNTSIKKIAIHHMAGVLNAWQCGNIFAQANRYGSSHYGVGYDGGIGIYVDEWNTAWTNSNWNSNCECVTIEVSNSSAGGQWPVNDTTLNSLIKLVADIAKRNNLGKLVKGQNVVWHSMYASTSCPGPYLLSKIDYICEQANKINAAATYNISIENIDNKKVILNKDCELWNLEFSTWSDAKSVKHFSKGTEIEVSAIAKHSIGSQYYLTEYSYSNGIKNGFNIKDCDDIIIKNPDIEIPKEDKPIEIPKEDEIIETPKEDIEIPKEDEIIETPKDKEPTETIERQNVMLWLIEIMFKSIGNIIRKLSKGGK